jgi:hypothetical protein
MEYSTNTNTKTQRKEKITLIHSNRKRMEIIARYMKKQLVEQIHSWKESRVQRM